MARALTALTIGPLDPDGRDGVLADLKTFSALGLHGSAVVTDVDETAIDAISVEAQLNRVLGAIRVDTVKLVCPADTLVLEVVAAALTRHDVQHLVLDPAGAAFPAEAVGVLKSRLLPLTLMALPDIAEAEAITSTTIETWDDAREAARAIAAMGPANVVIKGGSREGAQVTDLLYDGKDYRDYTAERVQLVGVRGTGTTFGAGVAATLAKGESVQHSIAAAKAYVTKALQGAYDLGGTPGLHHFYRYWQPSAQ